MFGRCGVNDACSILLTNSWEEDLLTLDDAAIAWVRANSMVLTIDRKLFIE